MKKILVLTKYDRQGASSRLRSFQYIDYFRKNNMEPNVIFDIQVLLPDCYLSVIYQNKRKPKLIVLKAFLKRFFFLLRHVKKYDVLWIEKEVFPNVPWFIEYWLLHKKKVIVDYDDAIFHNYDLSSSTLIKWFLAKKIDKLMAYSSVVIAGNSYLASRAETAGAKKIEVLPTTIDLDRYPLEEKKEIELNHKPIIGWIGNPGSQVLLLNIENVLAKLGDQFRLVLIGASRHVGLTKVAYELWPWSETIEVELLKKIDIGIMPLRDGPFQRGKCAYKLIQYAACAKAVVASDIGPANRQVVDHGVNGFLATNEADWINYLTLLLHDADQRKKMGMLGRKKIEKEFSLQTMAPRFLDILMGEL